MAGVKLPMRSTCVPGRSHSALMSGVVASVAQLMTSAQAHDEPRSSATLASTPSPRS